MFLYRSFVLYSLLVLLASSSLLLPSDTERRRSPFDIVPAVAPFIPFSFALYLDTERLHMMLCSLSPVGPLTFPHFPSPLPLSPFYSLSLHTVECLCPTVSDPTYECTSPALACQATVAQCFPFFLFLCVLGNCGPLSLTLLMTPYRPTCYAFTTAK